MHFNDVVHSEQQYEYIRQAVINHESAAIFRTRYGRVMKEYLFEESINLEYEVNIDQLSYAFLEITENYRQDNEELTPLIELV